MDVIDHVTTGPVEGRGVYAHYRVAVRFAEWVSEEFEALVEDVMAKFVSGDVSLIPEIIERHDEANDTTSRVLVQTIDSELGQTRYKAIQRNKETGQVIKNRKMHGSFYAIKNNLINRAAFAFEGNTAKFKIEKGLKKRSPRQFATAAQNDAIVMLEQIIKGVIVNSGDETPERDIVARAETLTAQMGSILRHSGISIQPLLPAPVVPVPIAVDHQIQN